MTKKNKAVPKKNLKVAAKSKAAKSARKAAFKSSKSTASKGKQSRRALAKPPRARQTKSQKAPQKKGMGSIAAKPAAAPAPVHKTPPKLEHKESKQFIAALRAYEQGIRLMHSSEFEKAIVAFEGLITTFPTEREVHDRGRTMIQICEQQLREKKRLNVRSADDHYDLGIADLNRRELDSAIEHLEHAQRLAPKADHILYALAAANAVLGDRVKALNLLKQAVNQRPENRFLAANDADFASLAGDAEFREIVTAGR